jgi:hypothetical protein
VPVEPRADLALLPLVQRGAADAEQGGLLGRVELPGFADAPEGAQRGLGRGGGADVDRRNGGLEDSSASEPGYPRACVTPPSITSVEPIT